LLDELRCSVEMLFATMNVKPTTTTAALSLSLSHTKSEKKAVEEEIN